MIRTIQTLKYLPSYLHFYKELSTITTTEDEELQILADETEIIKDNQFISTADENGITRFEELLHIIYSTGESLEFRKQRALSRWNDTTPYTYRVLLAKLEELFGDLATYEINTDFKNYALEVKVNILESLTTQSAELDYLLQYMIPANIKTSSVMIREYNMTEDLFFGMASTKTINRTIRTSDTTHIIATHINTPLFDIRTKHRVIGGENYE